MSEETVNGYKETEIGMIPVEWNVVSVSSFADVNYGKARPKTEGRIPVVGSGGVYAYANESLVDYSTIVIGRKGNAGQAWLFETPCWPSDTTFYLEWKKDVNVRFLHGYMSLKPLSGEHAKTTLPSLQRADLENFLVPFPPLDEQQRITAVLSTIQQAIAKQEQVIQAARQLKRSLMHRLFTYGPHATPAPTKETEFGKIPGHWEIVELGELIASGPQNGLYKPQKLYGEGTPIIRIDDYDNNGMFVSFVFRRVDLNEAEIEKFLLEPNDLLVNRVNSLSHLGKTTIVPELPEQTIFESNMMRFAVDSTNILPEFAFICLCLPRTRTQMQGKAKRAVAQSSINQGDVKSLLIPLPRSKSEQQTIVNVTNTIDDKIREETSRKFALEALFKSMLHQLMTGQLRVPSPFPPQKAAGNKEAAT